MRPLPSPLLPSPLLVVQSTDSPRRARRRIMIFRLDACSSTLSTRSDRSSTFSPSPRRPQIKSASFGPATTAVRPWRLSRWSRSPAQAADRAHRTACRPALQRDARRGLDLLGGRQLGRHDPDRLLLVRPPPPTLPFPPCATLTPLSRPPAAAPASTRSTCHSRSRSPSTARSRRTSTSSCGASGRSYGATTASRTRASTVRRPSSPSSLKLARGARASSKGSGLGVSTKMR